MSKAIYFTSGDDVVEWYRSVRPETVYLIPNKIRHYEIFNAIKTGCDFAKDSNPDTIIRVSPDELTGTAVHVEILAESVVFNKDTLKQLCTILSIADNFEIRRHGWKVLFGFVFEDVYDYAQPSKPKLTLITNK